MLSTPEKFNTWLNMALVKSTFLEKLGGVVVVLFPEEPVIKYASFAAAKFNDEVSFNHARFNKNVAFSGAEFNGEVNSVETIFNGSVDFDLLKKYNIQNYRVDY
jgi:hypothetical protein